MRDVILTDRLILRDIDEDDASALFELDSDPEVMRYIGTRPADDLDWYRDRIRRVFMPWQSHPWQGIRVVLDRESEDFLGWVFARPATAHAKAAAIGWHRDDEIEIGYRYHRKSWGRGLATEAAMPLVEQALGDPATSAVIGCALATNLGSIRVLEKLGLERIGRIMLPDHDEPVIKLKRAR